MTKQFTLLLFIGLAFGENNSDLLIFKNGLQYHGEFLKMRGLMSIIQSREKENFMRVVVVFPAQLRIIIIFYLFL